VAISPSDADLQRFLARDADRPFVLVQLLRLADGGREQYLTYTTAAQPILLRIGATVLYGGEQAGAFVGEPWDAALVVRYPSRTAYAEMLKDADYQRIAHLRSNALREALLMPMDDWSAR